MEKIVGERLKAIITEYIHAIIPKKRAYPSKKTIYNKETLFFNRFMPWLNGREFTLQNCVDYILFCRTKGKKFKNSSNTIATITRNLKGLSNFIERRGYGKSFANNEALIVEEQTYREPDIFPFEVIERAIILGTEPKPCKPHVSGDNSKHRFYKNEARQCLKVILRSGMRIGDALRIKGTDLKPFDPIPSWWITRKGGKRQYLPMPPDMVDEMKSRMTKDRVFECSAELCNNVLQRGLKELGHSEYICNHIVRHIFASNHSAEGKPIQHIATLLGDTVETTDRVYSHYNIEAVAAVLYDNPVIKHGMPPQRIVNNIVKKVKEQIDDRIEISGGGINEKDGKCEVTLTLRWDKEKLSEENRRQREILG